MTYTGVQTERFWSNVDVRSSDECWPWKRSRTSNGYGQVGLRVDGKDRILKAHKVAWEIRNETMLSPGVRARHSCDNKLCCNPQHVVVQPDHLLGEYGTASAQVRGEQHGRSKLTEQQAIIIKYKLGSLSTREIADAFSVGFHTIWDIRKGITWRHI